MFGLSTLTHSAAFKSNMSTPPASLGPKKDLTTFASRRGIGRATREAFACLSRCGALSICQKVAAAL